MKENSNDTKQTETKIDSSDLNQDVYFFGGLKEYNLDQIETEVLHENIYLDVFAGSDLRLKKNIIPLEKTLSKVNNLETILFNWDESVKSKFNSGNNEREVGLIAQQVAIEFPELVKKDTETGFLTVNYTKLTTHLVEAIKELSQIVEEQTDK
ncbi:MAG: tail fiber domain-containing protein, partial [Bdellovibrionales bacterium]|nr:tail fiber domain-containing protein [Bdellovibrionales bacterium]